MEEIKTLNELDEVINKNDIVIIELGQDLCSPCKTLKAKLLDYVSKHEDTLVYYLDVMKFRGFMQSLGVLSTPTVLVYVDHKLTLKESGYFSLEILLDKLERIKKYYYSE